MRSAPRGTEGGVAAGSFFGMGNNRTKVLNQLYSKLGFCLIEIPAALDLRLRASGQSCDLYFPQIPLARKLSGGFQVFSNRVLNIRQSLFFRGSLRPAAGKPRARNAEPLIGGCQCN